MALISKKTKNNLLAILLLAGMYTITMYLRQEVNEYENKDELHLLEETAQQTFKNFIAAIEKETEWKVHITSGKRTPQQQAKLHQQNPKNAGAYESKHVYGLAIDLNLYSGYTLQFVRKADTKQTWADTGVPAIAKRFGLKWGGNFKTYYDPVHFEVVLPGSMPAD